MLKPATYLFSFLLIVLISTTNAQTLPYLHDLKDVVVIKQDEGNILSAFALAFLPNHNVVVTDKLDYSIKKFNLHGKIIQQAGGRGVGPGLFREPGPLDAFSNRIAVADLASTRVQILDDQLQFIRQVNVSGVLIDAKFDNSGRLWIATHSGFKGTALTCFSTEGKPVQQISPRNSTGEIFGDIFSLAITHEDNIILVYAIRNRVEVWDANGRFIREFQVPGIPLKPKSLTPIPRFGKRVEIPDGKLFWSAASDRHGLIYILAADYTPLKHRNVYVLDNKGDLRAILTLPQPSVSIRIGPDGYLYSIDAKRTTVRKHSIPKELGKSK
jgi:hypothetical protein